MTMTAEQSQNEDIRKIGELIKGIKVAMLVTKEPDGSMRGRPMMTEQMEFDGTLWFFSNDYSAKNNEVRAEHDVQLTYMDASKNRYVSLSGIATVVHDKLKAKELWKPETSAWFPNGLDDPDLSLLKIHIMKGEYWDGPSKTMVKLRALAKTLQGETYKGEGGEHKKVLV